MRNVPAIAAAIGLSIPAIPAFVQPAVSYEVEKYTVYCADERIEISFWDLAQMIVRRGNPVCAFATYTSYSDAITFAQKNFGGEGSDCWC
ncbi:MAG: hypothetical protein KF723_20800 [Rhizobiaceae bacterium]|nr:hypothetical protein [Rhizobiaceae bacterium]